MDPAGPCLLTKLSWPVGPSYSTGPEAARLMLAEGMQKLNGTDHVAGAVAAGCPGQSV